MIALAGFLAAAIIPPAIGAACTLYRWGPSLGWRTYRDDAMAHALSSVSGALVWAVTVGLIVQVTR